MTTAVPVASAAGIPAAQGFEHLQATRVATWTYVDEARTHEVQVRVTTGPRGGEFRARESPCGAHGAADAFETVLLFREPWEARFHLTDLEGRLALGGRYWRTGSEQPGWVPLRRHPGVPSVPLRAVELPHEGRTVGFHHFHHAGSMLDRLLVSVPRPVAAGVRYLVADLAFRVPGVDDGNLAILHDHLAAGPLRSLLTRHHVEAARQGYDKLLTPAEFALVYGPDWREQLLDVLDQTMRRIDRRRVGPGAASARGPADDGAVITDFGGILNDPRMLAVHRRFLRPGEEDALLAQGAPGIRRAIADKRRAHPHHAQHLLSLLEASLLARLGLREGGRIEPDVARQLRRLAFYL